MTKRTRRPLVPATSVERRRPDLIRRIDELHLEHPFAGPHTGPDVQA